MKIKTIIKFITVLAFIFILEVAVISCDILNHSDNNDDDTAGTENTPPIEGDVPLGTEGLIYNSKTELKLILLDFDYYEEFATDFVYTLLDTVDDRLTVRYYDDTNVFEHEIVIGPSERSVSRDAYSRLEELMKDKGAEFGGYMLYSNGSSIALAYTEEIGNQHLDKIMKDLTAKAKTVSMVAKEGVVSQEVFNMYEIYGEEDKLRQDKAFAELEKATSKEVADALRTLYNTLYKRDNKNDLVVWLANLYQPRTCVCNNYVNGVNVCLHPVDNSGRDICKNGGFYYSNGARDTNGFLPDIESTYQALQFLEKTGMLWEYGDRFGRFISGQLREDIVAFTKGLQNSDGYFYHPQWTIEESKAAPERVPRDLMWSKAILSAFGERPYYDTPDGSMKGTGGRPSSVSDLTLRLITPTVSAVSRVVITANVEETDVDAQLAMLPEYYRSVDALKEYLKTRHLDIWGTGYGVASSFASDVNLIRRANQLLNQKHPDKPDAFKDTLFEWIESTHREDNGLWTPTCYDALNAAFKILMVYSAFGMQFPYAEQALNSAIEVLKSDEDPGHVCGTYNTWYDISGLISNIRKYKSSEEADRLQAYVIEIAPDAILQTIVNTQRFICDDGSFSYFADRTSETSSGIVVTPRGKMGDVNASLICSGGLIEFMGQALGVKLPPIYGTRELVEFMDILSKNY